MLYEFALAPEILYEASRSARDFRNLVREFRIGEPNVISNFPKFKKFRKLVLANCPDDLRENDHTRLDELIVFVSDALRVERSAEYNGNNNWLSNVEAEQQRVKFDYVLTDEKSDDLNCLTFGQLLDGIVEHPRRLLLLRNADEMCGAIANLLRLATRIIFVDPYFREVSRSWNPFVRFVEASTNLMPCSDVSIEIIFRDGPNQAPTEILAQKFRNEHAALADLCSVTFKAIEELQGKEKIHNRYILTDIGGLSFGIGLSEDINENYTDDVFLLNEVQYQLRWRQYAELSDFGLVEDSKA